MIGNYVPLKVMLPRELHSVQFRLREGHAAMAE